MFILIFSLITFAPPSVAHGPVKLCEPDLVTTEVSLKACVYARYLIEDGVIAPVVKVERVLGVMNQVRERDLLDHVFDKIGPAGQVLPRIGDLVHLSEQLTQVNRGYQALRRRCARISEDLNANHHFVEALILRSDSVLKSLTTYVAERPGRDTDWVRDQIRRIRRQIDLFRTECLENLPRQSKGFFDWVDRLLSP